MPFLSSGYKKVIVYNLLQSKSKIMKINIKNPNICTLISGLKLNSNKEVNSL